jgi:SWI/SNF-related matrix-associated actin-dependent regulator 1 of chromatin subfamily A
MPFNKVLCNQCHKVAESEKEFSIGNKTILRLKCGHLLEKAELNHSSSEHLRSLDGKRLYKFQNDGVRFIESSGGRCLLADEMGLGKTVQALGALALHPELLPALYVVKSSLKTQWAKEIMRWIGEDEFAQVLDSPKDSVIPGLNHYIISYDIVRRFAGSKSKDTDETVSETREKEQGNLEKLIKKLRAKTIVLDECQQIKNVTSQRTIFVRALCSFVDNVIALSGTPIKNNASEYFPVLNILKPERYNNFSKFLANDCDSYFTGYGYKTGGLRNPEEFLRKTQSFILRRERKEVLPDLPPIVRNFQFCDLSKEVEKAYIEEFKKFRDDYNSGDEESMNTLAYLSKMRHLVGLSKIDPCIDFVMEIMGSTEDRVCIFVHHKDVAEILCQKLNKVFEALEIPPCARHDAGAQSSDTEKNFEKSRVLVCSTLAGGEGLNLQHLCFRFIMLERQWNPANEEQAEARFPRPEGLVVEAIDGTYFVAVGTVDEFFSELVERKREIVNKTLSGKAVEWDQSSLMKELSEVLASSGGRKWSI